MYFQVKQSAKAGTYYFVLKAGNHEVVAQSQMYTTKASAKKTIESIKAGLSPETEVQDLTDED
ncbi:YegP family protein [Erysipelothrix sp. HDW6C]|uniref:YegP family protein n=1 Tax=Erysipelothrix sp. HDW6C TaxID=2714930 RepID=UPI0014092B6B|nr:YegP family protein [Erysipelothrix sp. HDW6C]QIK69873.1 YegP family protein [Erysipelothrix sp. HDW6C]